ncbi:hypothetical protein KW792_00945 [Candidatus Saccharibacteria bacterium]|nr:hypothetical protein [Candidatus Saccharibacteria bacterium]
MEELAHHQEQDHQTDPYPGVERMLPDGESMLAYRRRVGEDKAGKYATALAIHRQMLADDRGISLEQLHEGYPRNAATLQ